MFNKISGLMVVATVAGIFSTTSSVQAATFKPDSAWFSSLQQVQTSGTIANNRSVTAEQVSTLPANSGVSFQKYVQQERLELNDIVNKKVDLSQLKLKDNYNVVTTFLNEGAGFRNQLGYRTTVNNVETGKGLIFQDASCKTNCVMSNGDSGKVNIGDWRGLGNIAGGTQLDFILRADGANSGSNVYGVKADNNPDQLQHMVAYYIGKHLLIGYEDLFGAKGATGGKNQQSDRDFNDLVFVVEIGENNLTSVPEPGNMAALLGVTGAAVWMRRKKQVKALG